MLSAICESGAIVILCCTIYKSINCGGTIPICNPISSPNINLHYSYMYYNDCSAHSYSPVHAAGDENLIGTAESPVSVKNI